MTLSKGFAQLRGATEANYGSLKMPLIRYTRSFRELEREIRPNPRTVEAPEAALETTEDETVKAHPLAWDACARCQLRGAYHDMFHCWGCEEAYHPLCISAIGADKPRDPRYHNFLCPGCAEDNTVLQLLTSDE